eukprot:8508349-Pyramimonas_sp.AAC.1
MPPSPGVNLLKSFCCIDLGCWGGAEGVAEGAHSRCQYVRCDCVASSPLASCLTLCVQCGGVTDKLTD